MVRTNEGGRIVVSKADFNSHVAGTDYKHNADSLLMNPPLPGVLAHADVQETLEAIGSFITGTSGNFVSIGSASNRGDFTIGDTGITNLWDAFQAAFLDSRLSPQGGNILVKSGSYVLTQKVVLPTNISIYGENNATIIDSGIDPTNAECMFEIPEATAPISLGFDDDLTIGAITSLQGKSRNTLANLVLTDNFGGFGTPLGKSTPYPSLNNAYNAYAGFIKAKQGSILNINNVTFLGLTDKVNRESTGYCLFYDTNPTVNPTIAEVTGCYADGISQFIKYNGSKGATDSLIVSNNKVRWMGSILKAAYSPSPAPFDDSTTSCIVLSLCDSKISNNNFTGLLFNNFPNDYMNGSPCIFVKGTAVSDNRCVIHRMYNSGTVIEPDFFASNPDLVENLRRRFFAFDSTIDAIQGVDVGNQFGNCVGSDWSITIGDGINSTGDISGVKALDLALEYVEEQNTIPNNRSAFTIFVNHGTYRLTNNNSALGAVNLIGVPSVRGEQSIVDAEINPTVELELTHSNLDIFSNKTIYLGWNLENIAFKISLLASEPYYTITLKDINDSIDVELKCSIKNCKFTNVGLIFDRNFDNDYASLVRLVNHRTTINVEKCDFYQMDVSFQNYMLVIPTVAESINVRDTSFNGFGYPFLIGKHPIWNAAVKPTYGVINLDNVSVSMYNGQTGTEPGYSVSAFPPARTFDATGYAWLSCMSLGSPEYDVNLNSCSINSIYYEQNVPHYEVFDSSLLGVDVAGPSLTNSGLNRLISIQGKEVRVNNSKIFGPLQGFQNLTNPGTYCSVTTLFIEARKANVVGCNIVGGAPLYIKDLPYTGSVYYGGNGGGPEFLKSGGQIVVDNCYIGNYNNVTEATSCITSAVSIFCRAGNITSNYIEPSISITNNIITSDVPHNNNQQHTVQPFPPTSSPYHTRGFGVQVYAKDWSISLINNTISGYLPSSDQGSVVDLFDNGIVVCDNIGAPLAPPTTNLNFRPNVCLSNNSINGQCYATNTAGNRKYCLANIVAISANVNNNNMIYKVSSPIGAFYKNFLLFGNYKDSNGDFNDIGNITFTNYANINNNTFFLDGDFLDSGIVLPMTSGICVNNYFTPNRDAPTTNGPNSSTTNWFVDYDLADFVTGGTNISNWIRKDNKGQTEISKFSHFNSYTVDYAFAGTIVRYYDLEMNTGINQANAAITVQPGAFDFLIARDLTQMLANQYGTINHITIDFALGPDAVDFVGTSILITVYDMNKVYPAGAYQYPVAVINGGPTTFTVDTSITPVKSNRLKISIEFLGTLGGGIPKTLYMTSISLGILY